MQATPPAPKAQRSLTRCPGPHRTIQQIADQLRRDLDTAVPLSEIPDGGHFSFLDIIGGVWHKTNLTRYNAVNTQTEAHCTVRAFDLVVPVTRYVEAAEAVPATPTDRPFLTVSGWPLPPGVPS